YARATALARFEPVRISFANNEAGSCYVVHTGSASQCGCNGDDGNAHCIAPAQAFKTVFVPAQDAVAMQANTASLLFDPVHGTTTPSATEKMIGTGPRV